MTPRAHTPASPAHRRWPVIAALIPLLIVAFVAGRAAAAELSGPPESGDGERGAGDDACAPFDLPWPGAGERLPDAGWPPGLEPLPEPRGDVPRSATDLPRFGWLPDGWHTSQVRSETRSSGRAARRSMGLEAAGPLGSIQLAATTVADPAAEIERVTDGVEHTTHELRGTTARSWITGERRLLIWAETSGVVARLAAPATLGVDDAVRIAAGIEWHDPATLR